MSKEKIKKICPICNTEFEVWPCMANKRKYCSIKCVGVGNKGKLSGDKNPSKRLEVKQKMSDSQKLRLSNKENHPNFGKKFSEKTKLKLSIMRKGKSVGKGIPKSEAHKEKIRQTLKGRTPPNKGKKMTDAQKQKISQNHWTKNPKYQGKNHPSYKGGRKRDYEYSSLFTSEFKKNIFSKSNYTCQLCGIRNKKGLGKSIKLHCHHINYNKRDMDEKNLIVLCNSCHAKTNHNREYWKKLFNYQPKQYSLLIGRYQTPEPHQGHILLVKTLLDQGKNVCIALREEDGSDKNPFSQYERLCAFEKVFEKEVLSGKIIVIDFPDIEGVYYGRDVGYKIEQIKLDEKIEAISATKAREEMKKQGKL